MPAARMQRLGGGTTIPNHDFAAGAVETIAGAAEVVIFTVGRDIAARDYVVVAHEFARSG